MHSMIKSSCVSLRVRRDADEYFAVRLDYKRNKAIFTDILRKELPVYQRVKYIQGNLDDEIIKEYKQDEVNTMLSDLD